MVLWPLRLKILYDALHGVWQGSKSWDLELGVLPDIVSWEFTSILSPDLGWGVLFVFLSYHPEYPSPLRTSIFSFLYSLMQLIRTHHFLHGLHAYQHKLPTLLHLLISKDGLSV
jgi:hypothetical protein